MTLKTQNFEKKSDIFFAEKFWETILTYFQKFSAKIVRFWSKKWLISKDLKKKKICQNGKFGLVAPVKHVSFLFVFIFVFVFVFVFFLWPKC